MLEQRYIDEIKLELEHIHTVIKEAVNILTEYRDVEPDNIRKTAAGSFLAQFYNGVENILKRIIKMQGLSLPKGENWHFDLFKMFCNPIKENLPLLFENGLETEMNLYRKFRHVVYHGYGFQLDWETMKEGIEKVEVTFKKFSAKILEFIVTGSEE